MKAMDVPHTYNAWDIDEHDFPHDGSAEEKFDVLFVVCDTGSIHLQYAALDF